MHNKGLSLPEVYSARIDLDHANVVRCGDPGDTRSSTNANGWRLAVSLRNGDRGLDAIQDTVPTWRRPHLRMSIEPAALMD